MCVAGALLTLLSAIHTYAHDHGQRDVREHSHEIRDLRKHSPEHAHHHDREEHKEPDEENHAECVLCAISTLSTDKTVDPDVIYYWPIWSSLDFITPKINRPPKSFWLDPNSARGPPFSSLSF